jgi:hypothetical protein
VWWLQKSIQTSSEGSAAVDTETVDRQFSALQHQAQQTATLIQTLADKLSTTANAGDPHAREWALDLKEIALAIRDEQSTTTELLQAIHALVDNQSGSICRPACAADRSIASRPRRASPGVRKLPNQPSPSMPMRRNAAGAEPPSQMSSGGTGRGATAAALTVKYRPWKPL